VSAPPIERADLFARLRAAEHRIGDDVLLAIVWIAERAASNTLDATPHRSFTHGGSPRGFEIHDLTGLAVVSAVRAVDSILALLGRAPAPRGYPERAGR
jgi:hypothetical protein